MKILEKVFLSKDFILVLFLILLFALVKTLTDQPKTPPKYLPVKQIELIKNSSTKNFEKTKVSVEIAKKELDLNKGLSGRMNLAKNSGMLFELGERKYVTFWMKDMHFPLDIIWIDNSIIIGIEKNAPIQNGKNIPTFTSPKPVTTVLEVNAGFSDANNINTGDKFSEIN